MTTGTHGYVPISAAMILAAVFHGTACTGIAALGFLAGLPMAKSSMLPDLIGVWGGSIQGRWEEYNRAHHGDVGKVRACMSSFYRLHLWLDSFTHPGPNNEPPPLGKMWQYILFEAGVLAVCAGGVAYTYGFATLLVSYLAVWVFAGSAVLFSWFYSPHYKHPQ